MTVVVLAFCLGFGYRANHIVSYESFYMTPKILSVSLLTTKEHPYKVKKIYKAVSSKLIYIRFLTLSLIMKKLPCRFFLCHPKYARKVSGLLRNRALAPIVR